MATGFSNKLTGQIGEYLACAELGKRGYIATSFTGNVPEFDLIITNEKIMTIPIQVKTTRGDNWPTRANLWIDITIDENEKKQIDNGNIQIENPDLIYICIALSGLSEQSKDRFFILRKKELQTICSENYRGWISQHNWKRPRNYKSLDNRYYIKNLEKFENNWGLIKEVLGS